MRNEMHRSKGLLGLAVILIAALALDEATAQPALRPSSPVILASPPAGAICKQCVQPYARVPLAPPPHFDPVTASDAQLDAYGFPPRPDANASPAAFADWKRVVSLPVRRVVPLLQASNISMPPMNARDQDPNSSRAERSTQNVTSSAWSGYAVFSSKKPFGVPNSFVYASFVVPIAQQALGACSSTWDYAAAWIGLDGWTVGGKGNPDYLSAGINMDASCSNGTTSTAYEAFYEWYPNNQTFISNIPIGPGDQIFMYIWSTSPTVGHYFIVDVTKNISSSLELGAPASAKLRGSSAEWLVSTVSLNGQTQPLTNYIAMPWYDCFVSIPRGKTYSPSSAPTGAIYNVTLDRNNSILSYGYAGKNDDLTYANPTTGKISTLGGSPLWFFDSGLARSINQ